MKEELEPASASADTKIRSPLNVEIKVRQQDPDIPVPEPASDKEIAVVAAAQGWFVRCMVLSAVLSIVAVYVGYHIGRGWVPADDGTLSQSAWRVMQGQLPHRDFAEVYTGGLSMIHALAFRAFGVNLMSLRLCVFLFFLAWVPAVYYIALRFTSAVAAGFVTLLAVAWSFPNYPAAMPSWYNLFFATFGAAALLRYIDLRKARWLIIAGMCGGISIVIKVIGAYYVAGALLFLVFLEQSDQQEKNASPGKSSIPYRVFTCGALILFVATLVYFFHARLGVSEFYHFVLPAAVLTVFLLQGEQNIRGEATAGRFRNLLKLLAPFISGLLIPLAVFLAPYAKTGTLLRIGSGVSASAISHAVALGVIRPAPIEKTIFALLLIGIVVVAMFWQAAQSKLVVAAVAVGLGLMLFKAATSSAIVSGVWYSVAMLTPLVVGSAAAAMFADTKRDVRNPRQMQRIMALTSVAAMCSLVQYPFAAPIYLCYTLPLTMLAGVAIIATAKKQHGTYLLTVVAAFYLLFGVVVLVPDHIYELTHKMGPLDELPLERAGGLRVEYATGFADFIHFLQQHSPNGLMYAGNDCPELYFLSGLKNVTGNDGGAPPQEALQAVQSDDLNLVVINNAPFFGAVMAPEVIAQIATRFPHNARFGIFQVYWKK